MKTNMWVDQLYKDQPYEQGILLDQNHWLQAEAMILAQEKEKRRRRLFIILFAAGLLLIGSLAWKIGYTKPASKPEEEKINPAVPVADPGIAHVLPEEICDPILKENNIASKSNSKIVPSVEHLTIEQKRTAGINKNKTTHHPSIQSQNKDFISSNFKPQNDKLITKTNDPKNKIASANSIETLKATKSILQKEKNTIQEKALPNMNVISSKELAISENTQDLNTNAIPQTQSRYFEEPAFLNFEDLPLEKEKYIHGTTVFLEDQPIVLKRNHWKETGLQMTLAQESGLNGNSASIGQLNFALFQYRELKDRFFYGYGMGYTSGFNKTRYSKLVSTYLYQGFSGDYQNLGVRPQWLNYVNAQVHLGYRYKDHRFTLSTSPEVLIGAKGNIDQLKFTNGVKSLSQAQVVSSNEGWLGKNSVTSFSWNASFAYDYRIWNLLAIGVQVNHSLLSPFRQLDNELKQPGNTNWYTGFRISYFIK